MPERASKYDLANFCQACFHGDLELLTTMLDRTDPVYGFQGDINEHQPDYTALQYAAVNGQLECVKALLKAKADPHMRARMPRGRKPADGGTARQLAEDWGWDSIAEVLKDAEAKEPKGDYVLGGPLNNAKIYPSSLTATGRDPAEVKLASQQLLSMTKPYFLQASEQLSPIGLLFPGQGAQYVKMLSSIKDLQPVQTMAASAKSILGWDPLDVCLKGPTSKLEKPEICQPVMLFAGLAALEKLKVDEPSAATRPGAVAGLGAGELAALVAAGVLSFEDGLKVANVRATAMAKASGVGEAQAMLAVAGLRRDRLEALCAQVRAEGNLCGIANELFPKGAACAGTKVAMEKLEKLVKENGALQAKVTTLCGAFHTSLMAPAVPAVAEVLREVQLQPPRCDIYMNASGNPVFAGTSPKALVPLLLRQLTEPVLWESCVSNMIKAGISEFYEVGPGKQLKAMMKRIDAASFERTVSVEV